ncbi:MAG: pilus assembly protein HicB [Betaproteobacteria bacterium]|nr:pilus assembly protein HicB [Betaproteobacteria bacterium]
MSKSAYPLKMPNSVKAAAARLAKADGVSLNQFIAVAVAEKVGAMETAAEFLRRRAAKARPANLRHYLRRAPNVAPATEDAI